MSWLQYYQAVKRNDLETVKKAKRDFRIPLTMDKSAIELAALHGYKDLMEYFIMDCDKNKDFVLLIQVLKEALRGGQLELVKTVTTFLDISSVDTDVVKAAIQGKHLQCLEFVWSLAKCKEAEAYLWHAFCSGCHEILDFIRNATPDIVQVYETHFRVSNMPVSYLFIALNDYDKALEFHAACGDHRKDAKAYICFSGRGFVDSFSLFGVAGYFGHLDVLKRLFERERESPGKFGDLSFEEIKDSVVKFALWGNHKHIIEYLVKEENVPVKRPYFYADFLVNDAFHYLDELSRVFSAVGENVTSALNARLGQCFVIDTYDCGETLAENGNMTFILLGEDKSAARLTKIEAYYNYVLDSFADDDNVKVDIGKYFMEALTAQNVEAALSLRNRVTAQIGCNTTGYHGAFRRTMSTENGRLTYVLPSPVVVELLLSTLDGRLMCSCDRKLDPLREFFHTPRDLCAPDRVIVERETMNISLETYVRRAEVILQVLFRHGIPKLDPKRIAIYINYFLSSALNLFTATAGKVISVLRCCKVDVGEISTEESIPFFHLNWPNRDEILTELMIALFPNALKKKITSQCFLLYFIEPQDRRLHFLNCLEKTCTEVDDYYFDGDGPPEFLQSRDEFRKHLTEFSERVPSLQELARYSIHHHCLERAHECRGHLSMKTLLLELCEYLPAPLKEYLMFEDVYRTLNYEFRPRVEGCYLDKIEHWLSFGMYISLSPTVGDFDPEEHPGYDHPLHPWNLNLESNSEDDDDDSESESENDDSEGESEDSEIEGELM